MCIIIMIIQSKRNTAEAVYMAIVRIKRGPVVSRITEYYRDVNRGIALKEPRQCP